MEKNHCGRDDSYVRAEGATLEMEGELHVRGWRYGWGGGDSKNSKLRDLTTRNSGLEHVEKTTTDD